MLSIIQQYSDLSAVGTGRPNLIVASAVLYEQDGNYARLKLEIVFHDGSKLHVKDYYFAPDERKYAFHWSDSNGKLKIRWDNAQYCKRFLFFSF
jgi:hypothetical protein